MPVSSTRDGHLASLGDGIARFARCHGVCVDGAEISEWLGGADEAAPDLVRLAALLGPRFVAVEFPRSDRHGGLDLAALFAAQPLPMLVSIDAGLKLVTRVAGGRVTLHALTEPADAESLPLREFRAHFTGAAIVRREGQEGRSGRFGIADVLGALSPGRGIVMQAIGAAIAAQCLSLATPVFFQVVIDRVLVAGARDMLGLFTVILITVHALECGFTYLRGALLNHAATRMELSLAARAFAHLVDLPLALHWRAGRFDLADRAREVQTLRQTLAGPVVPFAAETLFAVSFLALLGAYAAGLALIVAAAMVANVGLAALALRPARRGSARRLGAESSETALVLETLDAIETVKACGLERSRQRAFEDRLAMRIRAMRELVGAQNLLTQAALMVSRTATALVLWRGAVAVMDGTLTLGQLVAANLLTTRVVGPQPRLVQLAGEWQRGRLALERFSALMALPAEPASGAVPAAPAQGRLAFRAVGFTYPGRTAPALEGVSIVVAPGEVVAVLAPAGAGKTTLARHASGLLIPDSGTVLFDGADLRSLAPRAVRRLVHVIDQTSATLSWSLADNVALGRAAGRAGAACEAAGLADLVASLPEGLASALGPGAFGLSDTERHRLGLARALASDAPVLVIDAALDALASADRRRAMEMLRAGRRRSVLILTQRPAVAQAADRVLVLEAGRVVDSAKTPEAAGGAAPGPASWRDAG